MHELEATLARHVGSGFRREGEAYLSHYPAFLIWAHYLYSLVFPVLLALVAIGWTYQQVQRQPRWSLPEWFDCAVTLMLLASLAMYLHAFHRRNSHPAAAARPERTGGLTIAETKRVPEAQGRRHPSALTYSPTWSSVRTPPTSNNRLVAKGIP